MNSELEHLRHKPSNPYEYSEEELAERQQVCEEHHKQFPHIPLAWVEYTYDFVKNTSEDELEQYKQLKKPSSRKVANNLI